MDPQAITPAERRQKLRASYAIVFGGEHGRTVLADLLKTYGFDPATGIECPSAHHNKRSEDVFLSEGMKEPVRRILSMSGASLIHNQQQQPTK